MNSLCQMDGSHGHLSTIESANVLKNELLVVELSHPAQLWREEGGIWLTHDQSTEDIELYRGEHRELAAGKVLIEGEGRLCFCGENLQLSPQSQGNALDVTGGLLAAVA